MKIELRRNYGFLCPIIIMFINSPRYIERKEFSMLFVFFGVIVIGVTIAEFMKFYKIENEKFYLETFFVKTNRLNIQTVKSITIKKGNWFTPDYLTIKHGKFDATYVKPKNNKVLIEAFLSLNPNIEVIL